MHNTSRCAEIEKRFPGLIITIVKAYKAQLAGKARANGTGKRKAATLNGKK
jgi:hypothetical protein